MRIPIEDQYNINGVEYFQFAITTTIGRRIFRDIPKDLSTASRYTLILLSGIVGMKYRGLEKKEWLNLLYKSIIFEKI
jgi:hypothetical protein